MTTKTLTEGMVLFRPDADYRRQGRHIIIAQIENILPLQMVIDPDIWGGGNARYTWGQVQQFFSRYPKARHGQQPCHYYCEYLDKDYVTYVGCPLTNRSWFLQMAVALGILPIMYLDAVLIVLQENYGVEVTDKRLWRVLAHTTLTPLMRMFDIPRSQVVFFENIANVDAVMAPEWTFRWRDPTFLDPLQLDLFLKEYEKR